MITKKSDALIWPIFLLILAIISVQGGASIAKHLFSLTGSSDVVTSLRLGMSAIMLLLFFKPWRLNFRQGNLRPLFFYGLALGAMNFLFYRAIQEIPIGIAVALEFTGPLSVALFYSRRPIDFVWIGLVIIGLLLLIPIGENTQNINLKGVLYALSAGVFWALYIIFGRGAGRHFGTATVSVGTLIAAMLFVPIGLVKQAPELFTTTILCLGFLVALFSSAIPYALEMMAMTRMPAKTFGTLSSLEPAFGALSGMVFLGEHLTLLQWLALSAIIAASMGAALTSRSQGKKKRKKPTSD